MGMTRVSNLKASAALLVVGLLVTLVVLALSACGGDQDSAKGGKGNEAAANKEIDNPLVGTWRRGNKCEELVHAYKEAGLADEMPGWIAGQGFATSASVSPSEIRKHSDPCQGLGESVQHDHVFYKDGRFASVNDVGEFVDSGHYKLPNDHTIVFPHSGSEPYPPVTAHFRFSDHLNTVTFDLVVPDMDECSAQCRESYAWAVSVFYEGQLWKRVPPEDQWPKEV
jgi:hypothetical protein